MKERLLNKYLVNNVGKVISNDKSIINVIDKADPGFTKRLRNRKLIPTDIYDIARITRTSINKLFPPTK